ncbi:MAG: transcriptional repressor [Chloroflexi bacterium]|jgi:Fe2+ or Zn2+ uptake regulation protein|nr:transcriptional repressor [Chloroflexota bacterium]
MSEQYQAPGSQRSSDIRLTPQRIAILQVLRSTDTHPDASWVYDEVRKQLPHISLATVYRNLTRLAEAGMIVKLELEGQVSRWDGRTQAHNHISCTRCGRVADIAPVSLTESVWDHITATSGFRVKGYYLTCYGCCPDCVQRDGARQSENV